MLVVPFALFVSACGNPDDEPKVATDGTEVTEAPPTSGASPTTGPTTTAEAEADIKMPDLVGSTETEASAKLEDLGVDQSDIEVVLEESFDDAGTVLEQLPSSGSDVKGGITLTVAKEPAAMPDLVGKDINEVKDQLGDKVELTVEDRPSPDATDGKVIEQVPPAGSKLATQVKVVVARRSVETLLTDLEAIEGQPNAETVDINGSPYPNALSWSTSSSKQTTSYNLSRDFTRFKATVGLTDDSASDGTGTITIFEDQRELATKAVALGEQQELDLDVTGALRLTFVVEVSSNSGETYLALGSPRLLGTSNDSSSGDSATVGSEDTSDGSDGEADGATATGGDGLSGLDDSTAPGN